MPFLPPTGRHHSAVAMSQILGLLLALPLTLAGTLFLTYLISAA